MKDFLRIVSGGLLFFNGAGAVYGGFSLILFPDGSQLQLPIGLLQYTFFHDYFIPGIVLLLINGIFSFFVLAATLMTVKRYELLIMAQGILLFVWIIIQIILIRNLNFLHFVLASVGLILVLTGYRLYRNNYDRYQKPL